MIGKRVCFALIALSSFPVSLSSTSSPDVVGGMWTASGGIETDSAAGGLMIRARDEGSASWSFLAPRGLLGDQRAIIGGRLGEKFDAPNLRRLVLGLLPLDHLAKEKSGAFGRIGSIEPPLHLDTAFARTSPFLTCSGVLIYAHRVSPRRVSDRLHQLRGGMGKPRGSRRTAPQSTAQHDARDERPGRRPSRMPALPFRYE